MSFPKPSLSAGTTSTPSAGQSYATRRTGLVKQIAAASIADLPLGPHDFGTLAIEEAFHMFNETVLGQDLEEEPQTAAFMAALAAGTRFWAPWFAPAANALAWVHFSKTSETLIGADFAIVLANNQHYRMCIAQAKRITSDRGNTVNIRQPTSDDGLANNAHETLSALIMQTPVPAKAQGKHWQLTKLLGLRGLIRSTQPDIVYALWPDQGGEALYRDVESIRIEIKQQATPGTPAKWTQSIATGTAETLRSLLLGYCDPANAGSQAMQQAETVDVLKEIKTKCGVIVIIDVGTNDLGLQLTQAMQWPPNPPLQGLPGSGLHP